MDFVKSNSGLTHIVAALNENPKTLAARMHLGCDAVIVNQCHEDRVDFFQYEDHLIRVICSSAVSGVPVIRDCCLRNRRSS